MLRRTFRDIDIIRRSLMRWSPASGEKMVRDFIDNLTRGKRRR